MNIVYIHYHLKPGGVSKVIEQQCSICELANMYYIVLAAENSIQLPNVRIIPELAYDSFSLADVYAHSSFEERVQALASLIETHIVAGFPNNKSADIIHVHNATLAKNKALIPALNILQEKYALLLQLHDFAEDGRPQVYSKYRYPNKAHYTCINKRDKTNLVNSGLCPERLHYLPNLVSPLPQSKTAETEDNAHESASSPPIHQATKNTSTSRNGTQRFALYPVRGIRRKNLGEVLLLSLLFPDIRFGITLPPNNKVDIPAYNYWKRSALELKVSVDFEVGQNTKEGQTEGRQTEGSAQNNFERVLNEADFFITTSVQEGFGFSFLEPWTIGKAVAGRSVAYVVQDFVESGLNMQTLYQEIPIPKEAVDMPDFKEAWLKDARTRILTFRDQLQNHSVRFAESLLENLPQHFSELYEENDCIDFARLNTENQLLVLKKLQHSPRLAQHLLDSVPQFACAPYSTSSTASIQQLQNTIDHNQIQVQRAYGQEQYAKQLQADYRAVLNYPKQHPNYKGTESDLNKDRLLRHYLDPHQFFPITTFAG